jgi:hypothetical protein
MTHGLPFAAAVAHPSEAWGGMLLPDFAGEIAIHECISKARATNSSHGLPRPHCRHLPLSSPWKRIGHLNQRTPATTAAVDGPSRGDYV